MDQWIEILVEPRRLILVWRQPDWVKDRQHWAVGVLEGPESEARFRYLAGDEFRAMNDLRDPERLRGQGFSGYPAFPGWEPDKPTTIGEGALAAFLRRVPSRNRSDFAQYLEGFRLRVRPDLTGFALLGATGAALPSDGFTLVDPLDSAVREQDMLLEVQGYRHRPANGCAVPPLGAALELVAEPDNVYDSNAIQVRFGGDRLGYVARLQAPTVSQWIKSRAMTAQVAKVNGSAQRERLHMLMQVRSAAFASAA
jgi:hypothetical protein